MDDINRRAYNVTEIERLREENQRLREYIERLNERVDKRLTSFDLLFEMQEAWKVMQSGL